MVIRILNTATPLVLAISALAHGRADHVVLFLCASMLINAIYDSRQKEPTNDN